MNRRKAKKAFKKKWRSGGRIALLKTVPKGFSVREADKVNELFENTFTEKFFEALENSILYGSKRVYEPPLVYEPPQILPPLLPEVLLERMYKDIT